MEDQQKPESIEDTFPKNLESSEIKNETSEIEKLNDQLNRNDLIHKWSKHVYDFRRFWTIRSFSGGFFAVKLQYVKPMKSKAIY